MKDDKIIRMKKIMWCAYSQCVHTLEGIDRKSLHEIKTALEQIRNEIGKGLEI